MDDKAKESELHDTSLKASKEDDEVMAMWRRGRRLAHNCPAVQAFLATSVLPATQRYILR